MAWIKIDLKYSQLKIFRILFKNSFYQLFAV